MNSQFPQLIKTIVIGVIIALLFRFFVFSPIVVEGPSMNPTLQTGDQMIINKFTYRFFEPNRFDIVVFHATEEKDFIKRVVGLPGEHVAIIEDDLYVNGEYIDEVYLDKSSTTVKSQMSFRLEELKGNYEKIPEDHYLLLGDNRNDSTDSRQLGVVHKDDIIGKTSFIYWPPKRVEFVK